MTEKWRLNTNELDEGPREYFFDTKEEAIDYAVVWFASGYNPKTNETMRGRVPLGVAAHTAQLISDLTEGREFYCRNFYEKASLAQLGPNKLATSI